MVIALDGFVESFRRHTVQPREVRIEDDAVPADRPNPRRQRVIGWMTLFRWHRVHFIAAPPATQFPLGQGVAMSARSLRPGDRARVCW